MSHHAELGIQRPDHVALRAPDPAAAAAFAARHMGLAHVHTDDAGRAYLAAAGLDPYSLVYVPGEGGGIDHISYLVPDLATLERAADALERRGAAVQRLDDSGLWRGQPALRVTAPAGHAVQLTVGVHVDVPMVQQVASPAADAAPIALDHVAPAVVDVDAEIAFVRDTLGLKESATVVADGVGPVVGFFRGRLLYHCYTVVRAAQDGLHHFQFSLKDGDAVRAAGERLRGEDGVEVLWGPVRHGPAHSVALYFRDQVGNIVEFSAEEEIILRDETYAPRRWAAENPSVLDEWGSAPPPGFL